MRSGGEVGACVTAFASHFTVVLLTECKVYGNIFRGRCSFRMHRVRGRKKIVPNAEGVTMEMRWLCDEATHQLPLTFQSNHATRSGWRRLSAPDKSLMVSEWSGWILLLSCCHHSS
jgi:hypothetical protein